MALRAERGREFLKQALASSAVKESKLHLKSFLTGRWRSGVMGGDAESPLWEAADRVRDMELYFPVSAHRETWTGATAPIVGYVLGDRDDPIAYDQDGNPHLLNRAYPPAAPVLMLVPVESDFAEQKSLNLQGRAELDCIPEPAESVASAARRCRSQKHLGAEEISTAGRPSGVKDFLACSTGGCYPGLVLHEIRVLDDECGAECWAWGDPEYELHSYARKAGMPSNKGFDYRCSGDGAMPASYQWDMNGSQWSGAALVLSGVELNTMAQVDTGFSLQMWEDDTERCVNTGANISVASLVYGGGASYLAYDGLKTANWVSGIGLIAVAGYYTWHLLGDVLNGGDDFVAALIPKQATVFTYPSNAGKNVVLVRGGSYKGWAVLNYMTAAGTAGAATSIVLDQSAPKLPVGHTLTLHATAYDQAGFPLQSPSITWASSNSSIATVSPLGVVTGHQVGSVTITATVGALTAASSVSVMSIGAPVSMSILPSPIALPQGQTLQAVIQLRDANNFVVPVTAGTVWSTSNSSVCWVDGSGLVHGSAGGTATLTAVNDQFAVSVTCDVSFGTEWRAGADAQPDVSRNRRADDGSKRSARRSRLRVSPGDS